ncbi:DUF1275 domain-containing protein [Microbacterium trichothecenolyticum]|nr:DUF1275 domain-containing protein [Microbacterium trichothecenolyticum]
MMMVLTFVTGVVDAVGFLALDRVFVGNMTGNIVILGMALAGADDLPVLGPAIALVTFAAGAALAGVLLRAQSKDWSATVTALLAGGSGLTRDAGSSVSRARLGRFVRPGHRRLISDSRGHGSSSRRRSKAGRHGHDDRGGHLHIDVSGE